MPVLNGIGFALGAALTGTLLLAFVRAGAGGLSGFDMTFVRYLTGMSVIVPLAYFRLRPFNSSDGWQANLLGPALKWNFLRAVMAVIRLSLLFYALAHMPFANAQAINLTNAVFMILFAWGLLGEQLNAVVMVLAAVCLAGAIIIAGPQMEAGMLIPVPALAALAAAAIWGMESIVIKISSTMDNSTRILLSVNVIAFVLVIPLMVVFGGGQATPDWRLLVWVGPLAISTQFLNLAALRRAPANVIAAFRYVPIVFGLMLGWFWFGEWPSNSAFLGMALIAAGGTAIAVILSRPRTN